MGTTTLTRSLLTDTSMLGIITDALGTNAGDFASATDTGKGVKLAANAYVAVVKNDEIEGIVHSVEPGTRNAGYSWGGIQTTGRALAEVGASQDGAAMAVGDLVIADTPVALGTAGTLKVWSAGTGFPGAPSTWIWRCIRIVSGTGAAGDTVMIERVS